MLLKVESPKPGAALEVSGPKFSIGREDDCDLVLDDEKVSRHHAYIEVRDGQASIHDLGSSNGTYVNGARIAEPTPLRDGDPHSSREIPS